MAVSRKFKAVVRMEEEIAVALLYYDEEITIGGTKRVRLKCYSMISEDHCWWDQFQVGDVAP